MARPAARGPRRTSRSRRPRSLGSRTSAWPRSSSSIDAKLALGRHTEVIAELERLVDEHPYRERLRAQLMLALYRADRQADALQAYQNARRQLVEELGIEPGERLRELESARARAGSVAGAAPAASRAADAGARSARRRRPSCRPAS